MLSKSTGTQKPKEEIRTDRHFLVGLKGTARVYIIIANRLFPLNKRVVVDRIVHELVVVYLGSVIRDAQC